MISAAQHDEGSRRDTPVGTAAKPTTAAPTTAPVPAPRDGDEADAAAGRVGPGEGYAASSSPVGTARDRGLDDTVVRIEAAAGALAWVLLLALLGVVGLVLALLA